MVTARDSAQCHMLRVTYDHGFWAVRVDCPDEALGTTRPCAVWANDDGSEREDACTFQQYAEATDPEDWLCDVIEFPLIPIEGADSGDWWHAVKSPSAEEPS